MRTNRVHVAFEPDLSILPLATPIPTRKVTERIKRPSKYCCISASIDEVGSVEPLVVYRKPDTRGRYLLLNGHLRRAILMEKGHEEVECLLAHDDQAFTYNKRIDRLALVQEHALILRAIEQGISEAKLATILDRQIDYVKRRKSLLKGIAVEAVDLLKGQASQSGRI
ncbi:plasmid partitioning protein RepB C-terminal domain-containing protein [Bradyrhizobium sp. SZCCHNPS2010]|uniref:plasmid partitioning protein RepB C-terminal domain-containing protein n=1 Tax=Bradyrhizobium sp. SZCCHNPS2010 TaxID=3057333 RepID=UPI002916AF41|nr:plasmid partitioning protein RepB C-terminal domain-containing protein [Bradyrhizobium sp. SZCCHNPS2010]